MFDTSGAAAAALFGKDHVAHWLALNERDTARSLNQVEQGKQAANLALAGEALQQMGATDRAQREIDYYKWANKEAQKGERRRNSLALLGSLQGVGTAGRRLGYTPRQMQTLGSGDLLASVNQGLAQAAMLGNPSQLYANFWAPIASQAAALARSS